MVQYLTPKDEGAFVDFPKAKMDSLCVSIGRTFECPRCKGHGGWNLALNSYPLHSYEDTPENRHRYAHFKCMCEICNGYGYVRQSELNQNSGCLNNGHIWSFAQNLGKCYNRYKCLVCGTHQEVDSSD